MKGIYIFQYMNFVSFFYSTFCYYKIAKFIQNTDNFFYYTIFMFLQLPSFLKQTELSNSQAKQFIHTFDMTFTLKVTSVKMAIISQVIYLNINDKVYNFIQQKQVFLIGKYSNDSCLLYFELQCHSQKLKFTSDNVGTLKNFFDKLSKLLNQKGFKQFFKPLKKLGRGNFASVYLIESKLNHQVFAAKVFAREQQYSEKDGKKALQNEINMIRTLDHKNIMKFHGVYWTQSLIYVVLQYLSGGTLDSYIRRRMNISAEQIIKVIKQILQALDHLDKKNIMHRDLKPANIMRRQNTQQWVLADFGLAALTTQDYLYQKCGTAGFMAPEILNLENKTDKYNQICDMYSLGIIFYTLILGKCPYSGTQNQVFELNRKGQIQFTEQEQKQLHPQIISLIQNMLNTNPKKRIRANQALKSKVFSQSEVLDSMKKFISKDRERILAKILQFRCNV